MGFLEGGLKGEVNGGKKAVIIEETISPLQFDNPPTFNVGSSITTKEKTRTWKKITRGVE